jgi:hypothetical protein
MTYRMPGCTVYLYIVNLGVNVRFCRVADLDWRLGRVYFLAFLNPSRGQPAPSPYRQVGQASAIVGESTTELD